jgi:hypothetical protein
MTRGRLYFVGSLVLVALVGCGRSLFEQREAWRGEAEAACMRSGAVKESPVLVRIEPIEGPGVCGADYPLKVAALGSTSLLGFANDLQPPGLIPGSRSAAREPRWPIAQPSSWQPAQRPITHADMEAAAPMSLRPPGDLPGDGDAAADDPALNRAAPAITPARPFYRPPVEASPLPRDPRYESAPLPSSHGPGEAYPPAHQSVPLGPVSGQSITESIGPVVVKPAATLACPIVSALDQWIANAVQPAAMRWFGQPVVGIKQISAYSCRGMNGNPRARISEHAFGNALDIAAFTLADGRIVTIKRGWRGEPDEVGFLHDVQGAACRGFSTVLAPGSNRFHYDHMHVDLMRRSSRRSICNPKAIPGEVAAARAAQRRGYARRDDPAVTGSIRSYAGKAEDGETSDEDWIEHDGPRESVD